MTLERLRSPNPPVTTKVPPAREKTSNLAGFFCLCGPFSPDDADHNPNVCSMTEQILLAEHAFGFEVGECLRDGGKDLG
jgi:hypothetical protein